MSKKLSRRDFLKSAAMAVGTSYALPTVLWRSSMAHAASSNTTFVYVFLRGGMDGLSLLPPVDNDATIYAAARTNLATKNPLALNGPDGQKFGLHPKATSMQALFNAGTLAFINGFGRTGSSLSHFVQMEKIEGGRGDLASPNGFLNRTLMEIPTGAKSASIPGASLGAALAYSLRGTHPSLAIQSLDASMPKGGNSVLAAATLKERLAAFWSPAHTNTVAPEPLLRAAGITAGNATTLMTAARDNNTGVSPESDYGSLVQFRNAAKLIKTDPTVRVLTIDVVNWDFHADHAVKYPALLASLDKALGTFAKDLAAEWNNIVVLGMTEFGRRVEKNLTNGMDHGKGGTAFVMGGRVQGKRVYRVANYGLTTLDGGNIPVSIDYRHVVAEILTKHLGIPANKLGNIFPGFPTADLGVIG